jgi:hypothetical protein
MNNELTIKIKKDRPVHVTEEKMRKKEKKKRKLHGVCSMQRHRNR